mgnify:FL=1
MDLSLGDSFQVASATADVSNSDAATGSTTAATGESTDSDNSDSSNNTSTEESGTDDSADDADAEADTETEGDSEAEGGSPSEGDQGGSSTQESSSSVAVVVKRVDSSQALAAVSEGDSSATSRVVGALNLPGLSGRTTPSAARISGFLQQIQKLVLGR